MNVCISTTMNCYLSYVFLALPTQGQVELGNRGKGPVRLDVQPSVCEAILAHSSMMAGWISFILGTMITDQVPWAADAHKIEFGSVPNLTNCGNFFITF